MRSVVLALGGSLIDLDDPGFLRKLVSLFRDVSRVYRLYVVVGGGKTARKYIGFGRRLGVKEEKLDEIGIAVTRLNALFIACLMDEANKVIPVSTSEAAVVDKPVVVMGGTTPGHSTDAVAAELAARVSAERFVIATDVDGVFDKDPKKYKDARLFEEVTVEKLEEMGGSEWSKAGENVVIDGPALGIIKGLNCDVFVVNGKNLSNLRDTLLGKFFVGTKIKKG